MKREIRKSEVPVFVNEQEEAKWWASAAGRGFLKLHSARKKTAAERGGSKLVAKLARGNSVQIALRLASPDLAKARELAERKGLGYQTLLKMIVREGLQRIEHQLE